MPQLGSNNNINFVTINIAVVIQFQCGAASKVGGKASPPAIPKSSTLAVEIKY